jgi:hypothetical protein
MTASLFLFDLRAHGHPEPASFADLESLREDHASRPAARNLRFLEFALQLESRLAPEVARQCGLVGRAAVVRTAAWQVDLPEADTLAAYRDAIEIASALGLVAYDAQQGIGFLPDGRVLPDTLTGRLPTAPLEDRPLCGESEVRALLEPALTQLAAAHGFRPAPLMATRGAPAFELVRKSGPVEQRLRATLLRYEEVAIALNVHHADCDTFFRAVLPDGMSVPPTFKIDLGFFATGPSSLHRWHLAHSADLAPLLAAVRERLLPLADLTRDLAGIDYLLNDQRADAIRTPYRNAYSWMGRPQGSDGSNSLAELMRSNIARLMVAHLNRNPSVPEIAAWFDTDPATNRPSWQTAVEPRLRAMLGTTPPLAHWPDAAAHRAAMPVLPASLLQCAPHPHERRCHHWEITAALDQALDRDPTAFWDRFAGSTGAAELHRLWQDKAGTLPASERVEALGLDVRVVRMGREAPALAIDILMLEFPPVRGLDEMAVIALARAGTSWRKYRLGLLEREGEALQWVLTYSSGPGITRSVLAGPMSVEDLLAFIRERFEQA